MKAQATFVHHWKRLTSLGPSMVLDDAPYSPQGIFLSSFSSQEACCSLSDNSMLPKTTKYPLAKSPVDLCFNNVLSAYACQESCLY